MKKFIYKVPGGKLLKVALENEADLIKDIKITGDFFLYPEESLSLIEECVKNKKVEEIKDSLNSLIEQNNIELFGFSVEDLITTIKQAIDNG